MGSSRPELRSKTRPSLFSVSVSSSNFCFSLVVCFLLSAGMMGRRAPPSSRLARRRRGIGVCHTLNRANTVRLKQKNRTVLLLAKMSFAMIPPVRTDPVWGRAQYGPVQPLGRTGPSLRLVVWDWTGLVWTSPHTLAISTLFLSQVPLKT